MKNMHLIPAFVFTLFALSASAQQSDGPPAFSQADDNGDGILSEAEAEDALPEEVLVIDSNDNGEWNRSEAELALPDFSFEEESSSGENEDPAVGQSEYQAIVQALEERESTS